MSEFKLQVAIVDHLRGQKRVGNKIYPGQKPFPSLLVTHIYQGRSEKEGFFLKMLGVYAGMTDLLLMWPENIGFMEVKTKNGLLATPQKRFKWMCESYGFKWALVRSVQEAHDQTKKWVGRSAHDSVVEPDLRKWAEKRDAAFDFFKP